MGAALRPGLEAASPRSHFRYDNTHPIGGSHHQKIVVIDDAVAFNGGIDLTCRRWDTVRARAAERSTASSRARRIRRFTT